MKIHFAITFLVTSVAKYVLADDAIVTFFPSCKGVDFTALTKEEEDFVASCLQASYNSVHQIKDQGDYYLADIHPDGTAEGELGCGGYHGGGHCDLCHPCPVDDELCDWYYDDAVCNWAGLATMDTHAVWANLFKKELKEGPFTDTFGKARACVIHDEWSWNPNVEVAAAAQKTRALRG